MIRPGLRNIESSRHKGKVAFKYYVTNNLNISNEEVEYINRTHGGVMIVGYVYTFFAQHIFTTKCRQFGEQIHFAKKYPL